MFKNVLNVLLNSYNTLRSFHKRGLANEIMPKNVFNVLPNQCFVSRSYLCHNKISAKEFMNKSVCSRLHSNLISDKLYYFFANSKCYSQKNNQSKSIKNLASRINVLCQRKNKKIRKCQIDNGRKFQNLVAAFFQLQGSMRFSLNQYNPETQKIQQKVYTYQKKFYKELKSIQDLIKMQNQFKAEKLEKNTAYIFRFSQGNQGCDFLKIFKKEQKICAIVFQIKKSINSYSQIKNCFQNFLKNEKVLQLLNKITDKQIIFYLGCKEDNIKSKSKQSEINQINIKSEIMAKINKQKPIFRNAQQNNQYIKIVYGNFLQDIQLQNISGLKLFKEIKTNFHLKHITRLLRYRRRSNRKLQINAYQVMKTQEKQKKIIKFKNLSHRYFQVI